MSSFYKVKRIKKAKKNHKCWACSKEICAGEPYVKYIGGTGADFFCDSFHENCYGAIVDFENLSNYEERSETAVHEWFRNYRCDFCKRKQMKSYYHTCEMSHSVWCDRYEDEWKDTKTCPPEKSGFYKVPTYTGMGEPYAYYNKDYNSWIVDDGFWLPFNIYPDKWCNDYYYSMHLTKIYEEKQRKV